MSEVRAAAGGRPPTVNSVQWTLRRPINRAASLLGPAETPALAGLAPVEARAGPGAAATGRQRAGPSLTPDT